MPLCLLLFLFFFNDWLLPFIFFSIVLFKTTLRAWLPSREAFSKGRLKAVSLLSQSCLIMRLAGYAHYERLLMLSQRTMKKKREEEKGASVSWSPGGSFRAAPCEKLYRRGESRRNERKEPQERSPGKEGR